IADRALRSIGEAKKDHNVLAAVLTSIPHPLGLRFYRKRTSHEHQEIYEVADFAENATAALFRIIYPVVRWYLACVHAVMHCQWLADTGKEILHLFRHWSKTTIETNH